MEHCNNKGNCERSNNYVTLMTDAIIVFLFLCSILLFDTGFWQCYAILLFDTVCYNNVWYLDKVVSVMYIFLMLFFDSVVYISFSYCVLTEL